MDQDQMQQDNRIANMEQQEKARQDRMQRHMPLGYQIVNGKAELLPENAKIVEMIFTDYLKGISTYQISKKLTSLGVLNASHKPLWYHGSVGKILENQKYKGDGFYPPLIDPDVFEQVQARRRERAESLGRVKPPSSTASKKLFSGKLECGICGQPYRKYVEHCGQPQEKVRWRCKHYIYGNRVYCRNISLTEEQIETAFLSAVNQVVASPGLLKTAAVQKTKPENAASRMLTGQLQICLKTSQYSADEIRQMAYDRARAQYRAASIDDSSFQTQKLQVALAGKEKQTIFDPVLFRQMVQKIMVHKDGRLQVYLQNGVYLNTNIQ